MPGVRIQHPTERNAMFTLVDAAVPYLEPYECSKCHRVHTFQTFHIELDETGAGIVSPAVLERLKRLPLNPFQISNEVEKPPDQKIGMSIIRVPIAIKET